MLQSVMKLNELFLKMMIQKMDFWYYQIWNGIKKLIGIYIVPHS